MSTARLASLIHHAKNRLAGVIARLEESAAHADEIRELRVIAGELTGVLGLARASDPQAGVSLHEVDLESFFADVAAEARLLAPARLELETTADFSASLFPVWTFDSLLVRCVLLDALDNAWRHAARQVRFEACCRDGMLEFMVRDDGAGFPAAWLASENAPAGRLPEPQGSGEGLRLARRIAALHCLDGRCGEVDIANDGGAVFRLKLP
ncbi:MAG: ATP-binding protein [Zoogloea sp.]|nr:ATP-binding protein [Zoogloea sp.]